MSYNLQEFAGIIRNKTGNRYKSLDDEQLTNYWLSRYPGDREYINSDYANQGSDLGEKNYEGDLYRPSEVTQLPGDVWHQLKSGAVGIPAGAMGIFSSFLDPYKHEKTMERDILQAESYLSDTKNTQYDDINNRPEDPRAAVTWDYKASQHRIKKEKFEKRIPDYRKQIQDIQEIKKTSEGQRKQQLYDVSAGTTVKLQEWGQGHIDNWVSNDEKLRGMLKWKEDNPYEFGLMLAHPSTWGRGFADLLPSVLSMYAPGGIAKLGGGTLSMLSKLGNNKFTKVLGGVGSASSKTGDVLNKYSLGTMMALEGGDQFNRTYTYLVEEMKMDPNEAVAIAGNTAAIYAPLSGILERFQVKKAAKYLGIEKNVEKAFLTKMANRVMKGANLKKAKKAGTNVNAVLDFGMNSIEEGFVEGWQAGMGMIIDEAVKKGYGADGTNAMYHLHQNIMSTFQDEGLDVLIPPLSSKEEVNQGFYSAMLGSAVMGGGGKGLSSATSMAFKRWQAKNGKKEVEVEGSNVKLKVNGQTEAIIPEQDEEGARRTANQINTDTSGPVDVNLNIKTIDDYANETIEQLDGGRNQFQALDQQDVSSFMNSLPSEQSKILRYKSGDETNLGKRLSNIIEATGDANYFNKLGLSAEKLTQINNAIRIHHSQSKKNSFLNKIKSKSKKAKSVLNKKFDESMVDLSEDEMLSNIANADNTDIDSIISGQASRKISKAQAAAQIKAEEPTISDDQIADQGAKDIVDEYQVRLRNKDTKVLKSKNLTTSDKIAAIVIDVADNVGNTIKRLTDPKQVNATVLKAIAVDLGIDSQFNTKDYSSNKVAVATAIVNNVGSLFNLTGEDTGTTYTEDSFTGEQTTPDTPVDDSGDVPGYESDSFDSRETPSQIIETAKEIDRVKKAATTKKTQQKTSVKKPVAEPLEGQSPSDEWLQANADGMDDDDAAIEAMLNAESEKENDKNNKTDDESDNLTDDLCLF